MTVNEKQILQHFDISNMPEDALMHEGVGHDDDPPGRGSGRHAWGSGDNPYQHIRNWYDMVNNLKQKKDENGKPMFTDVELAKYLFEQKQLPKPSTGVLRAKVSYAHDELRKYEQQEVQRMAAEGKSVRYIADALGISTGSVRNRMKSEDEFKANKTTEVVNVLRDQLETRGPIQIGSGVELHLGVSKTRMDTAVELLKEEGYKQYYLYSKQRGGNDTTVKVLVPPDMSYKDVKEHPEKVVVPQFYVENNEITPVEPPRSVDSKRIRVVYNEEGGLEKDGLIELRRGVDDISLGRAHYAQVRIAIDGTHYLKGMAMYADDLPDGIDIRFNTNKHVGTPVMGTDNEHSVLKMIKRKDPEDPFGATIRLDDELILAQRHYTDENGQRQLSCLNIVNEEGDWSKWSKNLSSQFLSKQYPALAKKQLAEAYAHRKEEYDEIMSLTNPTVKKVLLEKFADGCDSASVYLKGAQMPGQMTHVILPFTDIPDGKCYAPRYPNGTEVVLIRHPFSGRFEMPSLVVDNTIQSAKNAIGNARDAIGINKRAADQMSGADYDGDTAIVIPNDSHDIRTHPAMKELLNFSTTDAYPETPGMKVMTPKIKQQEMGKVSNLITDMTAKGAVPRDEYCNDLVRAVKYSMVVIDAEKHRLDYIQCKKDMVIDELKEKYQGGANRGASTIISKSSAEEHIDLRKEGRTDIDPETGKKHTRYYDPETGEKLYSTVNDKDLYYTDIKKKVYVENPQTHKMNVKWEKIDYEHEKIVVDKETGRKYIEGHPEIELKEKQMKRTQSVPKMLLKSDAYELTSGGSKENPGTVMEAVYAEHANKLKALANEARKAYLATGELKYDSSAAKLYANEVKHLTDQLEEAKKERPLERQALAIAGTMVKAIMKENPGMEKDDIKKQRARCIKIARKRVGKKTVDIDISEREWEAIQHGAIHATTLREILHEADLDQVKQYAMPRQTKGLSAARISHARSMMRQGHTIGDIAESMGVSVSTLQNALDA